MNRSFALCLFCFTLLWANASSAQDERRGMTPADTLRIVGVADAQISPFGDWVAYTVSTNEGDRTQSTLWLARTGPDFTRPSDLGRGPQPLLPAGWNASTARWSPDGRRLAFLGTREKERGIWVVSLTDRQPRLVASF